MWKLETEKKFMIDLIIESLDFPRGKVAINFKGGRRHEIPVRDLPEVKRLTPTQRLKYQILDGVGFTFNDTHHAWHLKQLGFDVKVD